MGFSTMKEALLEQKITASNYKQFIDKVKSDLGPRLARLDEAKQLAAKAVGDKDITEPYAKVGVVHGKLVFRVKHKKGHYGDDDIILSENYEKSEEAGKLSTKTKDKGDLSPAGKPELTVKWWKDTLGGIPDECGLEGILKAYVSLESALKAKQSSAAHRDMAQFLPTLKNGVKNALSTYVDKNDQTLLKPFAALVADADSYHTNKAERYATALKASADALISSAHHATRLERIDEAMKTIVGAVSKPDKKSLNAADMAILSTRGLIVSARKDMKSYKVPDKLKGTVDDADLAGEVGDKPAQIIKQGEVELNNRVKLLDQLEVQVLEKVDELAKEVLEGKDDPKYAQDVKEVLDVYDKVVSDIKGKLPAAKLAANDAKKIVAPTDAVAIPNTMASIKMAVAKLVKVKKEAADIFSSIRQSGEGATLAKKKLKEDDLYLTRKKTTEAKGENKTVNYAASEGFAHLEEVLKALDTLDSAGTHKADIEKWTKTVVDNQKEMNAF